MEAYAIVWALKRWREYLLGQHFVIQTDNRALTWLFKSKELDGKIARWVMAIMEFDFDIEHRPGKDNTIADALSRSFEYDPVECTLEDLQLGSWMTHLFRCILRIRRMSRVGHLRKLHSKFYHRYLNAHLSHLYFLPSQ
jgi:hypothetical protein